MVIDVMVCCMSCVGGDAADGMGMVRYGLGDGRRSSRF